MKIAKAIVEIARINLFFVDLKIAYRQKQEIKVALRVWPLGIAAPLPGRMFKTSPEATYGRGRLKTYFRPKLIAIERPYVIPNAIANLHLYKRKNNPKIKINPI